jgi:hypothetical protein
MHSYMHTFALLLKSFCFSLCISLNSFKSQRKTTEIASSNDIDECCICLYAIAPFQALFVAPCSHTFHFKCCYPLLNNYPGFNCPLCRSYADLDANVAIEADEVQHIHIIKKKQREKCLIRCLFSSSFRLLKCLKMFQPVMMMYH